MMKLLIGVALAGAAIAVWMLGVNALLVIVGIGAGVAFAELIDLGATIEARKRGSSYRLRGKEPLVLGNGVPTGTPRVSTSGAAVSEGSLLGDISCQEGRMGGHIPVVSAQWVRDPTQAGQAIRLATPAWFAWLEVATTERFSYPLVDPSCGYIIGFMTVRKERRQRGGQYWAVFRRQGTRVCKIYLGRSATVTQARLETIAVQLRTHQTEKGTP